MPDFQFPHLLHANLSHQRSDEAWQDGGYKMAPKQKWAGVAQITQQE